MLHTSHMYDGSLITTVDNWNKLYRTHCTHHAHTLEIHKSTHLVNAFLLVHHPSAHRTETAALPFSVLQWKPDPGDPLLYRSPAQEREVGAAMAAAEVGGRRGSGGGGRGEWSWRGKSGKRRKQEEEGERNRGGRGDAEHCRDWNTICSSIFLNCRWEGQLENRATVRKSCSISARLRGG